MIYKVLFITLVISGIIFSRFFPVYYAFTNTPKGYSYVGQTSSYDPWDINLYVAAIRYGQHGHLTLINQYTTTENNEALIYPLYTIAGFFFRSLDPYLIYHILAASIIVLSCIILFALSYKIFKSYFYSILTMFLATRGGGFGWLTVQLFGDKIPSADLFFSNITFVSALQKPHDGLGTILLITSILTYYFYLTKRNIAYGFLFYFSLVSLMFIYPYHVLNVAFIGGFYTVYFAIKKKTIWFLPLFIAGLFTSGIVIFFSFQNIVSSGFAVVIGETIDKIGFLSFLSGYGIFIVLFLILIFVKRIHTHDNENKFLILWIIVSVLLSYFPIGYSRFFLRGLFFPFVLLSLLSIRNIISIPIKRILFVIFCTLMPLTSLYSFSDRINKSNSLDPWQYVMEDTDDMFKFLQDRKRDGVLAAYRLGNFIPAKTNKTVYLGHLFQTPEAIDKLNNILDFYSGQMSNEEALHLLISNNISFVVYGRDERILGGHVYPFLKLIFDTSNTKLYSL